MPTTYDRLRAGLQHAKRRKRWASLTDLTADILDRKPSAFRRRSGAAADPANYLQDPAIRTILKWAGTFGLLEENDEGAVRLTETGLAALASDDAFARQIRAAVKSYLESRGLPMEVILELINGIALPDVPDAETIADAAAKRQPPTDLLNSELRTLLFMLSCAAGLDRKVKVFYGSK